MSVYAISSAALSHLRPLVVDIVDQNVKEIRRSSKMMCDTEEQKHLNYIADTMESSVETATRALDCKDIIHNIKVKSTTSNTALNSQLDDLLRKQSEILQIAGNSLLNAKKHYSQQFMPGGLSDTPTITASAVTPTKFIALEENQEHDDTPTNSTQSTHSESIDQDKEYNDNDKDTPTMDTKCKDKDKDIENDKDLNLQQIFNKLQISVQNLAEHKTHVIRVDNNNDDQKEIDLNQEDMDEDENNKSKWEMRRIWVKGMVLATHFVTAVWLTLKDDLDTNDTNTPQ